VGAAANLTTISRNVCRFAAGAILGGGDAVNYCPSRFKSYDPGSGTYVGYDAMRHPCP
jgi:hypothetical protein